MSIAVTPHLNFRGDARRALEFYRSVFGGQLVALTFADAQLVTDPAEADQIIWGQVEAPNGFRIMAFDVPAARAYDTGQEAFFVSVRGDDADEVTALWNALSQGASVRQPLGASQWSPLYGMLTDAFGVTWVIDVSAQPAA